MRKILFALLLTVSGNAYAAVATTYCDAGTVYTSCNAGYYLSSSTCLACNKGTYKSNSGTATSCTTCPSSGGIAGTTAGTASDSITDCYLPSGATRSFSDSTGSGTETITSNCYYRN